MDQDQKFVWFCHRAAVVGFQEEEVFERLAAADQRLTGDTDASDHRK